MLPNGLLRQGFIFVPPGGYGLRFPHPPRRPLQSARDGDLPFPHGVHPPVVDVPHRPPSQRFLVPQGVAPVFRAPFLGLRLLALSVV